METVNSLTKPLQAPLTSDLQKLKKATEDFEQIFVNMMLKEMNKELGKTGFLDGGDYEKAFKDMLVDERAKQMSENGSFGLAKMMYKQLEQHVVAPLASRGKDSEQSLPRFRTKGLGSLETDVDPAELAKKAAMERLTYDYWRTQGNQE